MTARRAARPVDGVTTTDIATVADLLRQAARVLELGQVEAAAQTTRLALVALEQLPREGT